MNDEELIEALKNENFLLQKEVDRYREHNKKLIELLFRMRNELNKT